MAESSSAETSRIDYTARDYSAILAEMIAYAQRTFPEWSGADKAATLERVLMEGFAFQMDKYNYYLDAAGKEAFLQTAVLPSSVYRHASMLGYKPDVPHAATGRVVVASEATQLDDVVLPIGTQFTTDFIDELDAPLIYESDAEATVPANGGSATVHVVEGRTVGLTELLINRNTADEQTVKTEYMGTASGGANLTVSLAESPVLLDSIRVWVEDETDAVEWQKVDDLLDYGPDARVFAVTTSTAGVTRIIFGDGIRGVRPDLGLSLYCFYRVGGGTRGNIAAGLIKDLTSGYDGLYIASSSAMTDGRDAETLTSIRRNAPRVNRIQDRAVALRDYEDLALSIQGVAKSSAIGNTTSQVTVFLMGQSNFAPADDLITGTERYLQQRASIGVRVIVNAGTLVPVQVGTEADPVVLGVYPNFRAADVLLAGKQAIQTLLSDVNTDFGATLPASRAYRVLDEIPGVEFVKIPLFARIDSVQVGAQDILCRDWEIPAQGDTFIVTDGGI
ncbi:baseplate J/gp47 family protein [Streptomyces sp. NBC_00470]|uniref:baseplate J/gp47 family protein n=1 Tax=Streptomyces sp. NBC_00470 TaxID=2975753 RepID=UPI0030E1D049